MSASRAYMSTDVYMVCLSHALSTEREEVMGLLIGDIDERSACHISAVIMLRRSDKRKDRVEISPEQLSAASTEAEDLAQVLCRPMRVVGWYHSHPHITVWPSQLDVQTQGAYQMMDDGFIGIIFSVFNEDEQKNCRIQVTCFQSRSDENDPNMLVRIEIPLHITPTSYISYPCLNALAKLPKILCQEEQSAFGATGQVSDVDLLTKLHNYSVYAKSLCNIAEVIGGPLLQVLEARIFSNELKKQNLEKRRANLVEHLKVLMSKDYGSKNEHIGTEITKGCNIEQGDIDTSLSKECSIKEACHKADQAS